MNIVIILNIQSLIEKIMKELNQYILGKLSFVSFSLVVLFLFGCKASSTVITATWTNDEVQQPSYKNIVVAPLIADRVLNASMESELAKSLSERDVNVDMGRKFLPEEYTGLTSETDKKSILDAVTSSGADAVLTVSIISEESETRYVPGTYSYAPYSRYSYYGSFWGYYDYWSPRVFEPGYYVTDKFYYLETNLFDAQSEKLIWSAQTETYDPATIESFTDDFSRKIAMELTDDGII